MQSEGAIQDLKKVQGAIYDLKNLKQEFEHTKIFWIK